MESTSASSAAAPEVLRTGTHGYGSLRLAAAAARAHLGMIGFAIRLNADVSLETDRLAHASFCSRDRAIRNDCGSGYDGAVPTAGTWTAPRRGRVPTFHDVRPRATARQEVSP